MGLRFNPPPDWPLPPGFVPPVDWQPDPGWPPVPPGWSLWVADDAVPDAGLPPAPPVAYPASPYQAYGQGAAPANPRFNGFAIAGFVLGILGGVVLSIIFSIIGLVQIRDRHQRGKGLAIAGLALSGVWVVVIAIIIAVAVATQAGRSASGAVTRSGRVSIFSLRVGDCFQNPAEGHSTLTVTEVTATPCTTPHNAQVFAQFKSTDATYPGQQAMIVESSRGCQARVSTSLDKSKLTSTMSLHFLFPESAAWTSGQRSIACVVVDPTADLTSSLLAGGS